MKLAKEKKKKKFFFFQFSRRLLKVFSAVYVRVTGEEAKMEKFSIQFKILLRNDKLCEDIEFGLEPYSKINESQVQFDEREILIFVSLFSIN